jgi:hypothetical protein
MSDSKKKNYKKAYEQILIFLEKEYPEYLPDNNLSSQPILLSKTDEIWKKVCNELDWKFVPCDEKK